MEEKYWNNFMATGHINDYLCYKEMCFEIQNSKKCSGQTVPGNRHSIESKGQNSESDDSYRNGAIFRSYR